MHILLISAHLRCTGGKPCDWLKAQHTDDTAGSQVQPLQTCPV